MEEFEDVFVHRRRRPIAFPSAAVVVPPCARAPRGARRARARGTDTYYSSRYDVARKDWASHRSRAVRRRCVQRARRSPTPLRLVCIAPRISTASDVFVFGSKAATATSRARATRQARCLTRRALLCRYSRHRAAGPVFKGSITSSHRLVRRIPGEEARTQVEACWRFAPARESPLYEIFTCDERTTTITRNQDN